MLESTTKNRSDGGIQFQVRSELMEDYASAQALDAQAPNLVSCQDKQGEIQLITVGTDKCLYNIFPASELQTGWGIRPLHAPFEIVHVAIGRDLAGNIMILACGSDGILYWKSDETWSSWQDLGKPFGQLNILHLKSGYSSSGNLLFQASVFDPRSNQNGIISISPRNASMPWDYVSPWSSNIISGFLPGAGEQGEIEVSGQIESFPHSGAYASLTDPYGSGNKVFYFGEHEAIMRSFYSDPNVVITEIYGAAVEFGATEVFFLNSLGKASYLDKSKEIGENLVNLSTSALGEDLTFSSLAVSHSKTDASQKNGCLAFFALTTDGRLFHSSREVIVAGDSTTLGWSSLVEIAEGLAVGENNLTVSQNDQGIASCFASNDRGVIMRFLQDANGNWQTTPVTFPSLDSDVTPFPSYGTEITVLDDNEQAIPGHLLRITASDYQSVEINGTKVQIGPEKSYACPTNSAGRITIMAATAALANANYRISTNSSTDPASALIVSPSRYIQDHLCPNPGDQDSGPKDLQTTLKNAEYIDKNGEKQHLLSSNTDVTSLSNAIWHSMSLAKVAEDDTAQQEKIRVARLGDRAGVQITRSPEFGNRIEPRKISPQYWQISFDDSGPKFRYLDGSAGAASAIQGLTAQSLTAQDLSLSHFHKPAWGDLWRGLRYDISIIENVIVETISTVDSFAGEIANRVKATVQVVVNGISQILEYFVETVEEVFDMVEGIFETVAVGFDKLFTWLGKLFDWEYIISVHNQLNNQFATFFETTLPAQMAIAKGNVDRLFGDLQQKIADAKEGIGDVGNQPLNQTLDETRSDEPQIPGPSSNWAQNQVLNCDGGVISPRPKSQQPQNLSPIKQFEQDVFEDLKQFAEIITTSLQTAIAQGQSIENITPIQILEIAALTLAEDLTAGVKLAFDAAFDLVTFLVESIGELGSREWHIPVLSKLYKHLTGNPLTIFDAIALLMAVPAAPLLRGIELITGYGVVPLLEAHSERLRRLPTDRPDVKEGAETVDQSQLKAISAAIGVCYGVGQVLYSPFAVIRTLGELESRVLDLIGALIGGAGQALSIPLLPGQIDEGGSEADILPTAAVWSTNTSLWLFCDAFPAVVAFLTEATGSSKIGTEQEPLLGNKAAAAAEGEVLSYITDVMNMAGGGLLAVGFAIQAAVQARPDSSYMKGAPPEVKATDLIAKTAQNFFGISPRLLAPLRWDVFLPYGQPILALIAYGGTAGAGALSIIRTAENVAANEFHHVI